MKRSLLVIFFVSLTSLLLSCGGDGGGADPKGVEANTTPEQNRPTTSAGKLFDKGITKKQCDLLTADMVAEVAGVDSSVLKQQGMSSMCLYSWEGGHASLGFIRVRDTVEFARSSFENSYRDLTGEEVAQSMAKIDAGIEQAKAEGTTDVDPENAKVVTGAMSSIFSGGLQFEDVAGLGDAASMEITRTETEFGGKTFVSYANSLNVLTGNLEFSVSFSRDGEPKLYREDNIALARAVLKNLD